MELINNRSLNEDQIKELVELIKVKDRLDILSKTPSSGVTRNRRFRIDQGNFDKRNTNRLILEKYAMLSSSPDS